MASAHIKIQLCIVLYSLVFLVGSGQSPCPENCNCATNTAICNNSITTQFPDAIVYISIMNAAQIRLLPGVFGPSVEVITIDSSTISEIAPYAFSNLPSLKQLSFSNAFIDNIRPCAIHHIHSPAMISFQSCLIKDIESGAFSELYNLEKVSFSLTSVTSVEPYAFFNIQARNITISDSDIQNLNTSAFHSISNVSIFLISRMTSNSVRNGAFRKMSNIENVRIEKCRFRELQCNSLRVLREATPGNHDTFIFTNSTMVCSCSIIPLVSYSTNHSNFMTNTVICAKNTIQQFTPVKQLNSSFLKQACSEPQLSKQKCLPSEPSLPTCKLNVTTSTVTTSTSTTSSTTATTSTVTATVSSKTADPNRGTPSSAGACLVIPAAFVLLISKNVGLI